jgi:hypothetical protein
VLVILRLARDAVDFEKVVFLSHKFIPIVKVNAINKQVRSDNLPPPNTLLY